MVARLQLLALVSGASAVSLRRTGTDNCTCLNWKDVYYKHGVVCGQGAERYADFMELDEYRPAAARGDMVVQEWKEKTICKHMFKRMNFNYAINTRVAPAEVPDVYPKIRLTQQELATPAQWCYIKSSIECSQPKGFTVPGTDVSVRFMYNNEQPAVRDLPFEEILDLAKKNVLDLGTFLPNVGNLMIPHKKWAVVNVTDTDLADVKASNRPTMVMSRDIWGPRMFVHGDRVAKFMPGWPQGSRPMDDAAMAPM